jgi:cytoskeleton protein RodZ
MSEPARAPGARLRAERERRGLSLQKAADEMRLDVWVVEALEADQFDRIGPAVYAKGHLRKYAALLAIPADEVVGAYDSLHGKAAAAPALTAPVRMPQAPPLVSRVPTLQIAAAVALLLIVAGVLWWKPWQPRTTAASAAAASAAAPSTYESLGRPAASNGAAGAPLRSPEPAAGEGARPEPVAVAYGASDSAAPAAAAPAALLAATSSAVPSAEQGAGRARMRLSFSADSWVEVQDAAGRHIFSGYGRANSVKVLAGEAPLRVYLGYASGVQLEINDRAVAIGRAYVHGDVARFRAGADGLLRAYQGGGPAGGATASGTQPRG